MKKIITAIIITVMILTCAACSNKKAVYLISLPENGYYEKSASLELGFGDGHYKDEKAEQTRQIVIDSLTYTGEYMYTDNSPYYDCNADVYKIDNGKGFTCECKIAKKSGAVISYSFSVENYSQKVSDKSYEDCKLLAREAAVRAAGNGDYVLKNDNADQKPEHTDGCGDVYTFYFVRMLEKNKTNIVVTVRINTGGWICSCDTGANQSYDGLFTDRGFMHSPDEADSKTIDKKIKSVYKSEKKNIKWEITDRCFAKLKDGTFGVIYDIAVTTENGAVETVKLFKPDKKHT